MSHSSQTRAVSAADRVAKIKPMHAAAAFGGLVGLAIGAAYLGGTTARATTLRVQAERIQGATAAGFTEEALSAAAGGLDASALSIARRHDPYTSAGSAQRDRQAELISARLEQLRTTGDPNAMVNTLRQQFLAVDPDQPPAFVRTLEEILEQSGRAYPRFSTVLFSVFAVVGLLLAASGIFSVVSYTVTRRIHEFGIRRALGATGADIVRLVTSTTAKLLVVGVVIGIGGVLGLSSVIESYVQGWDPRDPIAFATVIALLLFVALVACWVPARRATAIQPVQALREE